VDRLSLSNFRCFAECAIELHPELTVFVAENGSGKTAILDAIRIALGTFVDTISGTKQTHGFERTDVRLVQQENGANAVLTMDPALPTRLVGDGFVAGNAIHWSHTLNGYSLRSRTTRKSAENLRKMAEQLRGNLGSQAPAHDEKATLLPLVAFYGTGRLWNQPMPSKSRASSASGRLNGYTHCLSRASSFKELVDWFQRKATEIRDPRFSQELSENLRLLAAVKEATQVVLRPTKWSQLDWNFESESLTVQHAEHGRLPVSVLSDGIRNTVALIADVAYRCAVLNPHLGDNVARLTPGVLIIDEVDMHLHPSWQQLVVDLLRKAFPSLQMVLSTHSPQVLSTVDRRSIRIVSVGDRGQGLINPPTMQTRGVESADVLAAAMKVDAEPPIEEARWLRDYRALIEDSQAQSPEALSIRAKIVSHFGETHRVVLDCNRLIRFQTFKLKRNPPEER
jgi:predicted ATP-binding protein involved in virulence